MAAKKTLAELKADLKRLHESCAVGDYDEAACIAYDKALAEYYEACTGGYEWFRKLMAEVDGRPIVSKIDREIYNALAYAIDNGCTTMVEIGRKDDMFGASTTYSKETVGYILGSLECILCNSDTSNDVRDFYEQRGVRY